jgi:biotin carboxyl carrier protein
MIKKLRVTVDGKSYDVTVEMPEQVSQAQSVASQAPAVSPPPPAPVHAVPAPAAAPAPAPQAASGPGVVPSPLSGRVTAVAVTVGQSVKEGDQLLTLEAMKMNTFVFAPKAGKVSTVNVAVGDAVNEGQALVQIS